MKLLRVLCAVILGIPTGAAAQTPPIERARAAIARGDLAEGEQALAQIDQSSVDRNDLDFLKGTLAAAKTDYPTAIALFRALLNRDPSLNRVRLDLARAYFLKGDDVAAEHYFRAALAQGVPPEVERNIGAFLDQIRRRKRWTVGVSLALAPDSNINAATSAQNVDLFGIPFQLDPAARKTSGVGLSAGVSGSYEWEISPDTKWKVGGSYFDTEYAKQDFTDRNLSLSTGPRFLFGEGREISVLATAGRRWFGGAPFSASAGGRIEGQMQLSPRLLLNGAVSGEQVSYDGGYGAYSGPVFGATATATYGIDAHSFVRGTGSVTRQQAKLEPLRATQYSLAGGYYRDALPFGLAAYGEVRGTVIPYDTALPAFGQVRHDVEMDYRLSFSNNRIDVHGFTPVITFLHTDRYSNIALYGYRRNRVEIGVTRNF